jgi:hypothetical protein
MTKLQINDRVTVAAFGTLHGATVLAIGGKVFVRLDGSQGQIWVSENQIVRA